MYSITRSITNHIYVFFFPFLFRIAYSFIASTCYALDLKKKTEKKQSFFFIIVFHFSSILMGIFSFFLCTFNMMIFFFFFNMIISPFRFVSVLIGCVLPYPHSYQTNVFVMITFFNFVNFLCCFCQMEKKKRYS